MIARAPTFKRWGISAKQIQELRTPIKDVEFINPPGKHHCALGAKRAHNEAFYEIMVFNLSKR